MSYIALLVTALGKEFYSSFVSLEQTKLAERDAVLDRTEVGLVNIELRLGS